MSIEVQEIWETCIVYICSKKIIKNLSSNITSNTIIVPKLLLRNNLKISVYKKSGYTGCHDRGSLYIYQKN